MLRAQAIAVFKELAANGLIDTACLHRGRKTGVFELRAKCSCDRSAIDPFLQKHNLPLEENKEKGWLISY